MEKSELLKNGSILPIGFGPGGLGYSAHGKKKSSGLSKIVAKVYNKLIGHPLRKKEYVNAISNAFKIGYRVLDYSCSYGDGTLIKQAISKSGVPRTSILITARVSNKAQMTHTVRNEVLDFIRNLGVEYIDILQFHWPVTDCYLDTWKEMEKLYEEGYVKYLGVANCHKHHLEEILKICKYRPVIGQFEIHPLFTQKELISYYHSQGIVVEAYTPIARYDDRLTRLPLLKKLEKKYNKTFVQIILRWHIQCGVIPLFRSFNPKHQQENFDIFNFEIDEEDMKLIDGININSRLRYDPDNCDFSIL